jgi:hypothetical protein
VVLDYIVGDRSQVALDYIVGDRVQVVVDYIVSDLAHAENILYDLQKSPLFATVDPL